MSQLIDLNGIWRLSSKRPDKKISARVPGDIIDDLEKAGIIPDPYYGYNYKNLDWIHRTEWTVSRSFAVGDEILAAERIELIFDGIDTFAEIRLNGKKLAVVQSMHLDYRIDVKPYIKEKNKLSVKFKALYDIKDATPEKKEYFACFDNKRILMRKAQCHFGWDWAPSLPGMGIYRGVRLEAGFTSRIDTYAIKTEMSGDITFKIELSGEGMAEGDTLTVKVAAGPGCEIGNDCYCLTQPADAEKYLANFQVKNPALWYPNGYGNQDLYNYSIELTRRGEIIDRKDGKLGIREVTLEERIKDGTSLSFAFIVNGRKVFCRGSNWVPADMMTGRITKERYRELVYTAKEANFNMFRIWGGGIYEHDDFYNFCDEAGIMIWQDFMFACQDIIDDIDEYVQVYVKEAIHQVKRLRNHPSITYWCGANEKPGAFHLHFPQYGTYLLGTVLRGICGHYDGTRPYGMASPMAYHDIDNDSRAGDCHNSVSEISLRDYKNYWQNFEKTLNNFSSECTAIGPCRYASMLKFVPEEMRDFRHAFFKDRFLGNPYTDEMPDFIEREIAAAEVFGKLTDLKDFVKKGTVFQADLMSAEIDYARSNCVSAGFLNWMYNDIWPTGTWSVIDYYLTVKPAYYAMSRSFEPVRFCFVRTAAGYTLNLINNSGAEIGGKVRFGLKTYAGKILSEKEMDIAVPADGIWQTKAEQGNKGTYLYAEFTAAGNKCTAVYDYNRYDESTPPVKVAYSCGAVKKEGGFYCARLKLKADSYARAVFIRLDKDGVKFCDNYFDLEGGAERIINITSREKFRPEDIQIFTFADEWDA